MFFLDGVKQKNFFAITTVLYTYKLLNIWPRPSTQVRESTVDSALYAGNLFKP